MLLNLQHYLLINYGNMNRRNFLKKTGVSVGSIFVGTLLSNCALSPLEELSPKNDNFEEQIRKSIERSNFGFYENDPSLFRQDRSLLIIDRYRFIDDKPFCQKEGLDYLIEFEVIAICKFNYDFYKYRHEIVESYKMADNITYFTTDNPSHEVCYIPCHSTEKIVFPIKIINRKNNRLELDPKYALPCIMTKDAFSNIWVKNNSMNFYKL